MAKRRLNVPVAIGLGIVVVLLIGGAIFVIYRYLPKDPRPYIKAGEEAEKRGDLKEAIRAYGRAYSFDEDNREPWGIRCGDLHWLAGSDNLAVQYYNGVVKFHPNSVPGKQRLVYLSEWYANVLRSETHWTNLQKQAEALLQLVPESAYGRLMLGIAQFNVGGGKNLTEALANLEKARQLDPNEPQAYYFAAVIKGVKPEQEDPANPPRDLAAADELMSFVPDGSTAAVASRFRIYHVQYQLAVKRDTDAAMKILDQITDGSAMTRAEQTVWATIAYEKARRDAQLAATQPDETTSDEAGGEEAATQPEIDLKLVESIYKSWQNDQVALLATLQNPPVRQEALDATIKDQPVSLDACRRLAMLYIRVGRYDDLQECVEKGLAIPLSSETGLMYNLMRSQKFDLALTGVRAELVQAERSRSREDYLALSDKLTGLGNEYAQMKERNPEYHQLMGQVAYRLGHLGIAQVELESALNLLESQTSQQNANARVSVAMTLIDVYRKLNNYRPAQSLLDSTLLLSPRMRDNPRIALVEAQLAADMHDYPTAKLKIEQALKADPEDRAALRLKAEVLTAEGDLKKANEIWAKLEGADDPTTLVREAVALRNDEKYNEAIAKCREALGKKPDMWVAALLEASCYQKLDKKDVAIGVLKDFQQANPEHQGVEQAIKLLEEGREKFEEWRKAQIEEQESPLQRELRLARESAGKALQPGAGEADVNAAKAEVARHLIAAENAATADQKLQIYLFGFELALQLKDFNLASRYLGELQVRNADGIGGLSYRARMNFVQGNWADAELDYREVIARRKTDALTRLMLARTLLAGGKPVDKAIDQLKVAIDQNPIYRAAWRDLVRALAQAGRKREAWQQAEAGLARLGQDPVLEEFRLEKWAETDPKRAIAAREETRKSSPDNIDNMVMLANLYNQQKEPAKAEAVLLEARENAPEASQLQMIQILANFYRRNNQPEKGEQLLTDYVAQHEKEPGAYWSVSNYFRMQGRPDDALFWLDKALEKIDTLPEATRAATRASLQLAKAELYVIKGNQDAALGAVQSAQDAFEKPVDRLQQQLATYQLDFGRLDDARRTIAAYKLTWPNDLNGDLLEGRLMMREGKFNQAVEAFDRIIRAKSDAALAYYQKAMALYRADPNGNRQEAITNIDRAVAYDPGLLNNAPWMDLARLHVEANQTSQALGIYNKVLERDPANIPVRLQKITLLHRDRRSRDVDTELAEALSLYNDVAAFHLAAGGVAMDRNDFAKAEGHFRDAMKRAPSAPEPILGLANALARQNKWQAIVTETDRWLNTEENKKLPPQVTANVYVRKALAYGKLKQTEQMFATLETSVEAAGESFNVLGQLAVLIQREVGEKEALDWLDRYVSKHPDKVEPRRIRSEVWARTGKAEEAITDLESLLAKQTGTDNEKIIEADLARIRQQAGHYAEAAKNFRRVLQLTNTQVSGNPDTDRINVGFQILNNYAYLMADNLNQAKQAIPMAEAAARLSNRDPNVLDTLGWCYVKAGGDENIQHGIDILEEARQAQPLPVIHYHLALAFRDLGKMETARSMAQEAVSRFGDADDKTAKDAKALLQQLNAG